MALARTTTATTITSMALRRFALAVLPALLLACGGGGEPQGPAAEAA